VLNELRFPRLGLGLLIVAVLGARPALAAEDPAATADLATDAGTALVQGAWRYQDVELTRVPFHSAGVDGQPTGAVVSTWDVQPHAGSRDFDDRDWPIIEASTLRQHRGAGRLSFAWYRIQLTIPPRVADFETRGANVVFETSIDDYAEVWVDGELPRAFAQSGGSMVKGWNAVNRLSVGRNVQPGQKIQIAVFGINGPLSDPLTNFIWMRLAKLSFYRPDPAVSGAIAVEPQEVNVHVERLDPEIDRIVPPNAKVFKLAEGFQFTEGPIWIRKDGYLQPTARSRFSLRATRVNDSTAQTIWFTSPTAVYSSPIRHSACRNSSMTRARSSVSAGFFARSTVRSL
jgi:gluconolactonase